MTLEDRNNKTNTKSHLSLSHTHIVDVKVPGYIMKDETSSLVADDGLN